jgi:DHA1 family bicyclomycin/chloramphenicol resistance-like MFS transporter
MSDRLRFVALLAAITSLGPFAMQSLAPALPVIARDMSIPAATAQLMLSLSILAIGVATLLLGPLSDHFGRRPVALVSLLVTLAASLAVAVAPTIETAIAARIVQAGAAGAGMVLGRAIARDLYGPVGAGQVIAQMTAVMVVVPMAAPVIGGVIVAFAGWRAVFVFTAAFALVVWVWARRALAESIVERAPSLGLGEIARSFRAVAGVRAFWGYCLVATGSLSSFLFFVGTAPYVAAEAYGAGPEVYGFGFVFVGGGYMASNLLYARLVGRVRGDTLMLGGLAAAIGSALGVWAAILIGWHGLETVFAAAILNALAAGMIVPNAMAGAVSAYPARAGAASSLLGFAQFTVAAVFTQIGAAIAHDSAAPMTLAMAALSGFGLVVFGALRSSRWR